LWAQTYEFGSAEFFDVQEHIATRIVGTWLPKLRENELQRIRLKRPDTMTAYDLVAEARDNIFQLTPDAFASAEILLNRALELDARYPQSRTMMAELLNLRVGQGWSTDVLGDAASVDDMTRSALTSDPFNVRALAIYGHNRSFLHRDYETATKLFERALGIAPNDATALMWRAKTAAYVGDGPTAVSQAERALKLSPRDSFLFRHYTGLCLAHYANGDFGEAVHWGLLGMREAPLYTANLRFTAAAMVEIGRIDDAREVVRQVHALQPSYGVRTVLDRHPFEDRGRRERIARALATAGLPD